MRIKLIALMLLLWSCCIPLWYGITITKDSWFVLLSDQPKLLGILAHLFCHQDIWHFISNCTIWVLAVWLGNNHRWRILGLSFLAALAASLLHAWILRTVADNPIALLGGSGIIFAWLGMVLFGNQLAAHRSPPSRWMIRLRWIVGALLLIHQIWLIIAVSWYGSGLSHLIAFVVGLALSWVIRRLFSKPLANEI